MLETPVHALAAALGVGDDLAERGAGILLKVALQEDEPSFLFKMRPLNVRGVRVVRQVAAHTRGRRTGGKREVGKKVVY